MDIRSFFRPQAATTAKSTEKNNNSKTVESKSKETELKKTAPSPAKASKQRKEESTKEKSRSEKHESKNGKRDKSSNVKKRRDSDESDVIVIEAKETESEKKTRKERVVKKQREDDFMASLKKEEEEERARRREQKLKEKERKEKEDVKKSSRKSKGGRDEKEDIVIVDDVKSKSKQKEKNGVDEKKPRKRKVVSESEEEVMVIDDSDAAEEVKDTKRKRRSKKVASSDEEEVEDKPKKGRPPKKEEKKKKKKGTILDSDSDGDVIPVTPQQKKPRRKKKEVTVVHDSDEEDKPKPLDDMFAKAAIATPKAAAKKASPAKKGTPVSVMDFFGTGTVHRTSVMTRSSGVKRKASESVQTISIDDYDIHDDDDFDETLKLLDTENMVKKKVKLDDDIESTSSSSVVEIKAVKKSPEKTSEKPSLAGKLSARFKASSEPPKKMSPLKGKSPLKMDVDQVDNVAKVKTPPKGKTPQKVVFTPKVATPAAKSSPPKAKETPKTSPGKPTSTNTSPKGTPGTSEKNRAAYRNYLHREGPRALGSKEIPEGAPNCLEDLTFVVTGVLESLERDEAKSLVEKYGGKVMTTLSKKTSYVVIGRDAGESKMAKAQQFGTKQIDEDGLLDLIRTRPGKRSKYEIQAEKAVAKERSEKLKSIVSSPSVSKVPKIEAASSQSKGVDTDSQTSQCSKKTASPTKKEGSTESLLWVDKYKPQTMKQIVGQQGDKSNARKLLIWLRDWHKNRTLGKKPSGGFNRWNDDGSGHKAALLSGPPGIGKTTTATLVAEEAGFSFIELNASDARNKKSLQGDVADLLKNRCLTGFLETGHLQSGAAKHCLLMDEVDGMSGNEDRGGMQELISLIKQSKVPIICMCNDRQHLKIRSLANHCFDLRFQRPRVEQIRGAVMSIMFKEGVKIPPPAVNEIIQASNQDIRQVIHNLEMFGASNRALTHEEVKRDANAAKKDFKIGPFDVCRQVFASGDETAKMTLNDKADLFFNDYNIAPLFVQENYVHVVPRAAERNNQKHMDLLAKAADSICEGDVVSQAVRSKQQWGLLPLQAIYSSVIPGELLRGHCGQMIAFPQWLGKNSSRTKVDRILGELGTHMRLKISANKESMNMEYRPHLKLKLTKPLQNEDGSGVPEVIEMLDEYDLLKDDFDNILEISQWTGEKNPMEGVATKTKSAFTRTYNKESHFLPYAQSQAIKKSRKGAASPTEELLGEEEGGVEEEAEEEEDEDDITKNPMIKVVNESAKGKGKGKGSQDSSGKGKGKTSKGSQESSGKASQGDGAKGKGRAKKK